MKIKYYFMLNIKTIIGNFKVYVVQTLIKILRAYIVLISERYVIVAQLNC